MPTPPPTPPAAPSVPKTQTTTAARGARELRDTMESIVIAFVLAFLFRTFEAEAFVIPTGSMAPTLYGRHKEGTCSECGYRVLVGASDEIDQTTGNFLRSFVNGAECPNCRAPHSFTKSDPVFNGDRILVNKFPYEVGEPRRWDVIVFKYPEEPKTNYIKRLVGLPGETLRLRQGDVYRSTGEGDEETLEILRKDDPSKQRELQILVYDDRYPAQALLKLGWPERWAAMEHGGAGWAEADAGWQRQQDRSFRLGLDAARDTRWLRYRHFVPGPTDWDAVEAGAAARLRPRAGLITDFCGYNAYTGGRPGHDVDPGLYWVGDLTLTCAVRIEEVGEQGELVFELNEGERTYRCRIDAHSGRARLVYADAGSRGGVETEVATADTGVSGPGAYTVSFANVDSRLCLWVDGDLVDFGAAASYEPPGGVGTLQAPTDRDLAPVGIGATNLAARVSDLLLERDIYYRNDLRHPQYEFTSPNAPVGIEEYDGSQSELRRLETLPAEWFAQYVRELATSKARKPGDRFYGVDFRFRLGPDEFIGMGDNSPASQDSRLWPNLRRDAHRYAIPRSALVGKAFFIYWPHGVPFLNDGKGYPAGPDSIFNAGPWRRFFYHVRGPEVVDDYPQFRVPFYPNVGRMERIR